MPDRYDNITIVLHWTIAIAFIGEVLLGIYLGGVPRGTPARAYWVNIHKSIGITIGLAAVAMLVRRFLVRPPALPATLPRWEHASALGVHTLLYMCLLGIPLTGYIASNFSRFGVKYFGIVELKPWGPDDKNIYAIFNGAHDVLAWTAAVLVILHIAAALKHAFVDRDSVIQRMLPRLRPGQGNRL